MMYVLDVFLFFDFLSFLKDCFLSAKVPFLLESEGNP